MRSVRPFTPYAKTLAALGKAKTHEARIKAGQAWRKADNALTQLSSRKYKKYVGLDPKEEIIRSGIPVLHFNAGYGLGKFQGARNMARIIVPVFKALTIKRGQGPWTKKERRDWEAAFKKLKILLNRDPMGGNKRRPDHKRN